MHNETLGVGLTGKSLTDLERQILRDSTPYAVILFGRNIADAQQLRELVREVKSIARRPPMFMIDEEGGRVDRLRHLVPGLPSAEAFGEGEQPVELCSWMGTLIGMVLRYFDIEMNLAPVVDIRGEQPSKGLERRTFGRDAETVIELAGAFLRGLHASGAGACLKHFPGIGLGSADPHYGATIIDVSLEELTRRDLVPFERLGNEARAIMIGHGTYPQIDDPHLPATLSRRITTDLLRETAGFRGLAVSDDMEMHAVSDCGSYEVIAERALHAGNDVIMLGSQVERVPEIQHVLEQKAREEGAFRTRVEEAAARRAAYRQHIDRLREAAPPPVNTFQELLDEAARFVEAFEKTRSPDYEPRIQPRSPGGGPTGREEWT